MSSGTNIARESSRGGFGMGCSMRPPSSAISAHSSIRGTPQDIRDWLTSLLAASPASLFPWPGSGSEKTTHETCGRRPLNAFAWYDRDGRCWRMSQDCLLPDMSDEYSGTWPKSGMTHGGDAFRQPPLERRISERGSGLWPTPNASDATGGPGSSGRDGGLNLRTVANGQLNPDWVEWLMGWPIGWTSLEPLPRGSWEVWIEGVVAGEWWLEEPDGIPRVCGKVPNRVARIKALGNGQVPLCAATAWNLLRR